LNGTAFSCPDGFTVTSVVVQTKGKGDATLYGCVNPTSGR